MAYEKTVWVNGQAPALDAEHLNKIEQGIADAVSVTAQSLTDGQKTQARGNINAAPGGYGLGEDATIPEGRSANNITASGFYYCDKDTPNSNDWLILHIQRNDGYAVQFGRTYNQGSGWPIATRVRNVSISNAWQPWEWVNPPMILDTEYRTTERYLGKPVYVKTVQAFSSLTGSDVTDVCEVPVDNADKCISCTGETAENWSLPSNVIGGGSNHIYIGAQVFDANVIKILARTDRSDWTSAIRVTIKYTKTTD